MSAPPNDGGKQAAAGAGDGAIFTDADAAGAGSGDDDSEEEDIVYVPPPRSTAKVQMNFTERIFPTPLRESKVGASTVCSGGCPARLGCFLHSSIMVRSMSTVDCLQRKKRTGLRRTKWLWTSGARN